ncbi:MAG TPA: alpha-ketoacid dehydrogenase subunit beta [candidate division Zixibacteria bacterium]|nr:alpha-ketoacid dehydrogenase subunit beta [candidate division Zixibacteria bacterium]
MALLTYREAIRQALQEELHHDERVFLLGEDIAEFGGSMKVTLGLLDEFGPRRIRNTPISEMAILGATVGSAATGLRPIAEIMYSDFFPMAMDPIINQAAKMRYMFGGKLSIPLVIRAPMGGRRSAAAQHSQCLEAWFMHIPGIMIAMPSSPYDAKGLLKSAVRSPNPVIFFENKMLYNEKGEVPEEPYFVPFGQANIVRVGEDVTIVALSDMVQFSLKAADQLASQGISAEVIDPRTLAPLDVATLVQSVQKTGRLVVAHEANLTCGVGAEIASQIAYQAFDYLLAPVERVAAKDSPVPFNPRLEKEVLPDDKDVVAAVSRLMAYGN